MTWQGGKKPGPARLTAIPFAQLRPLVAGPNPTVEGGAAGSTARPGKPDSADVHVVTQAETLTQIATGQLAPYDALFGGKLRVGGNLEMAKSITQHLSDPAVPYFPPC